MPERPRFLDASSCLLPYKRLLRSERFIIKHSESILRHLCSYTQAYTHKYTHPQAHTQATTHTSDNPSTHIRHGPVHEARLLHRRCCSCVYVERPARCRPWQRWPEVQVSRGQSASGGRHLLRLGRQLVGRMHVILSRLGRTRPEQHEGKHPHARRLVRMPVLQRQRRCRPRQERRPVMEDVQG